MIRETWTGGVDQYDQSSNQGAVKHIDPGQQVQDGAQTDHLGPQPADIYRNHPERGIDPRGFAVFLFDDISYGQAILLPETAYDEYTRQDQADGSGKGIGDHTPQLAGIDGCGHAHTGTGAEPGRQQRGGRHPERQPPSGHQKIAHILDFPARQITDQQHDQNVKTDSRPENDSGRPIQCDYTCNHARILFLFPVSKPSAAGAVRKFRNIYFINIVRENGIVQWFSCFL